MTGVSCGQKRGVRIATFNILNGRTPTERFVDEGRYAEAIASLDADVLGLQEVDRNQPRSAGLDLTALAAEAMGAVDHRFEPALWGTPGTRWVPSDADEQPSAAAYGIALLSRYPVLGWRAFRLPRIRTRAPHLMRESMRPVWVQEEPRTALLAELETPLGRMRVLTTHLSFLPWWNGHQLRALIRRAGPSEVATVLTGDLNLPPRRAARLTGMRPVASGLTFPAADPTVQLDHILVKGRLRAVSGGAVTMPVSDHLALVADLHDDQSPR
jgi:endonuclease/exonuclease/phosphatase family metal-dependent hydrolase